MVSSENSLSIGVRKNDTLHFITPSDDYALAKEILGEIVRCSKTVEGSLHNEALELRNFSENSAKYKAITTLINKHLLPHGKIALCPDEHNVQFDFNGSRRLLAVMRRSFNVESAQFSATVGWEVAEIFRERQILEMTIITVARSAMHALSKVIVGLEHEEHVNENTLLLPKRSAAKKDFCCILL